MTRCDECGAETAMPFTCQYCGGKFCAEHRLPPNHNCKNISEWNKKPLPSVGLSYGRGGGVTATGGGYATVQRGGRKGGPAGGIPWLKVMIGIIALIVLAFAFLALGGYIS